VEIKAAVDAYRQLQTRNGGDPCIDRRLGDLLERAGFSDIRQQARYENDAPLSPIADFFANNLEEAGDTRNAQTWRAFAMRRRGMFAQAWVSCTGLKPAGGSSRDRRDAGWRGAT
jgi:hypothetical protein